MSSERFLTFVRNDSPGLKRFRKNSLNRFKDMADVYSFNHKVFRAHTSCRNATECIIGKMPVLLKCSASTFGESSNKRRMWGGGLNNDGNKLGTMIASSSPSKNI